MDVHTGSTPSVGEQGDRIVRRPAVVVGIVLLLMMVAVLNNMDRVLLAVLAEPIKAEFGLTDTQFGALSGVIFAAFYTAGAIPIARLADLYGRSLVLGCCVVMWSMATALSGAATSFFQMAVARASVGLGEAGCSPAVHALIAENVPLRWRGRALGLIGAGAPIGGMAGMLVGGILAEVVGWRLTFAIAGVLGVVLGVLVMIFLKRPRDQAPVSAGPAPSFWGLVRSHGSDAVFLLRCAAAVCSVVTITATAAWTAAFAMRAFSLPISQVGFWLGLSTGLAVFGVLLGGALVSRTGPRGEVSMRIPALCSIVGGLLCAAGYLAPTWPVMIVTFTLGHSLLSTWYAPIFTAVQADAPPEARAQLAAIVLLATSSLGVGVGPTMVGVISDAAAGRLGSGSLGFALAIASTFSCLAGVAMLLADRLSHHRAAPVHIHGANR